MSTAYHSGLYKAPEIGPLSPNSPLFGKNVFFIEPYEPGLTIYAELGEDVDVKLQLADWEGTIITDLTELHIQALSLNEGFIPFASRAGIDRYQIFFDAKLNVVEFVDPKGQFISPGMLAHLLQNHVGTQNIIAKGQLDQAALNEILEKNDELIVKPSIKLNIGDDNSRPLYARISKSMAPHS